MSYRLIDSNAIAIKYPEVNEMPCVFANLPDGMNGQFIDVQPEVLACGNGELIAKLEPHWIPVSERLPESGTYCLFTVFEHDSELEATTIETVYGCFDDYGERRYWSWEDEFGNCCIMGEEQLDGDHDEIIEKVLAWMPLPEPYNPNK